MVKKYKSIKKRKHYLTRRKRGGAGTPQLRKTRAIKQIQDALKSRRDIKTRKVSDFKTLLSQRVAKYKSQITTLNLQGVDLSGIVLSSKNLAGINLKKANLSDAKLNSTSLIGANLSKAILERAEMKKARLMMANLTGANLTNTDLTNADLTRANLTSAVLNNTKLSNPINTKTTLVETNFQNAKFEDIYLYGTFIISCNFDKANFLRCVFYENVSFNHCAFNDSKFKDSKFSGPNFFNECSLIKSVWNNIKDFAKINFKKSDLTKSNYTDCIFKGCGIFESNLTDAVFINCEFINSRFHDVNFTNVNMVDNVEIWGSTFHKCKFDNADFEGVSFNPNGLDPIFFDPDSNIETANLKGASFINARGFKKRNFDGRNLENIDFGGVELNQCSFKDCNLRNAKFTGADILNCNFTGADVTNADFVAVRNRESAAGLKKETGKEIARDAHVAWGKIKMVPLFQYLINDLLFDWTENLDYKYSREEEHVFKGFIENIPKTNKYMNIYVLDRLEEIIEKSALSIEKEEELINQLNQCKYAYEDWDYMGTLPATEYHLMPKGLTYAIIYYVVLEYILQQSDNFRELYITALLHENLHAHKGAPSCVLGMIERIITKIPEAAITLGEDDPNKKFEYFKLSNLIEPAYNMPENAESAAIIEAQEKEAKGKQKELSIILEVSQKMLEDWRAQYIKKEHVNTADYDQAADSKNILADYKAELEKQLTKDDKLTSQQKTTKNDNIAKDVNDMGLMLDMDDTYFTDGGGRRGKKGKKGKRMTRKNYKNKRGIFTLSTKEFNKLFNRVRKA